MNWIDRHLEPPRGKVGLRTLLVVVGFLLSVALLSTVFVDYEWDGGLIATARFSAEDFTEELPRNLPWMLPFALLSASIIPLRAIQWKRTLKTDRPVPFAERHHMVALGALANNAFPAKLGEVVRSLLMARTQKIPFVRSLGSVAVCKLLEFAALMLLVSASLLGPFANTMQNFSGALRVALPICLGLVLAVMLLAHYSGPLARKAEGHPKLHKLESTLKEISLGLGAARSFRGMGVALAFSIPPVLAPTIAYGLGLQGIGVPAGLFGGAVILGAISVGQSAIGVPAGMGIYYFVTSWTARSLGASPEQAAVFATFTHVLTVLSHVTMGLISLKMRKLKWSDLKRSRGQAQGALRDAERELEEVPA